jgi:REP element-mobilizing transposase RayT
VLDEARIGPVYLRQPRIADMVVDALFHTEKVLQQCTIHAFAVMPNHVHWLATPKVPLSQLMRTVKSFTARKANLMLGLTGTSFWQDESYDHVVRDSASVERVRRYIEHNPVRAGLVVEAEEYRWSSAGGLTKGQAAGHRPAPL